MQRGAKFLLKAAQSVSIKSHRCQSVMKRRPTNRPELENQKKAYQSPVLVSYGTVRDLTRAISPTGKADGAMSGNFRSQTGVG
jgi:hypothetical protein